MFSSPFNYGVRSCLLLSWSTLLSLYPGHARTMCTLAARLVKLRPVTVTFFTVPAFYDRAQAEIAREFAQGEESVASRIR